MNAFLSNELWLVVLIGMICVLGGFGLFARWCAFSPAVRREKLEDLRVGMTTAEVVAIVGQPRDTREAPEGRVWIYGSRMKRHVLMMQFNQSNKLQSFAHGVPGANHRTPAPYDSRHES
jgi:outer membrane protein assembly factor BamE (lipoprotein component of BamABCDE complex)